MNPYIFLVLEALFAALAALLLKKGAGGFASINPTLANIPEIFMTFIKSPYIIVGVFLYGMSFVLWTFVLSRLKLSVVYPISVSSIIVLTTLLATIFFKESITPLHIVGIVIIMLGISLLVANQ